MQDVSQHEAVSKLLELNEGRRGGRRRGGTERKGTKGIDPLHQGLGRRGGVFFFLANHWSLWSCDCVGVRWLCGVGNAIWEDA